MADTIAIELQAILSQTTPGDINAQIKALQAKLQPLGLKIDTDKIKDSYEIAKNGVKSLVEKEIVVSDEKFKQYTYLAKIEKSTGKLVIDKMKELEATKQTTLQLQKQENAQAKMLNKIDKYMIANEKFIEKAGLTQQYQDLRADIAQADTTSKNYNTTLEKQSVEYGKLDVAVSGVKKQIQQASVFTEIFGQSISDAVRKFTGNTASYVEKSA